jgi:hypothetical protein
MAIHRHRREVLKALCQNDFQSQSGIINDALIALSSRWHIDGVFGSPDGVIGPLLAARLAATAAQLDPPALASTTPRHVERAGIGLFGPAQQAEIRS